MEVLIASAGLMTGRSPQGFYSATHVLLGVAGLVVWFLLGQGQGPQESQFFRLASLAFGTLHLFEGLARYRPGPNLGTLSLIERHGVFAAVALLTAVMVLTADTDNDFDHTLSVRGDAVLVVFFASVLHFLFAASNETLGDRALKTRLGAVVASALLVGGLGLVAALSVFPTFLEPREALALPVLIVVGGLATMPRALRAWRRHGAFAGDPLVDLRRRVEAAQRGDGDALLLRLRESGAGGQLFEVLGGEARELVAPGGGVTRVDLGQCVLVAGAQVVTSTRGGSGYRGAEEYERLDGWREALEIARLPLPEAPPRPPHPLYVEAALVVSVLVLSGLSLFVGRVAYP